MKCPLLLSATRTHQKPYGKEEVECLKEECAKWDEIRLCCGDRSLRLEVARLVERLDMIYGKMPYPPAPKH